ncbi:hypothetical protein ACFFRR_009394 [Megaselia abdita]
MVLLMAIIGTTFAQSNSYLPPKQNGYDYPAPPGRPSPGRPAPPPGRPGPGPSPSRPRGEPGPNDVHEPGMPFDFQYAVNDQPSSNDFSHKANSNGDITTGEYRVQMPDGRTQVVKYTADWKTGYHADVSYEGEAQYPQGPSAGGGGRTGTGGAGGGYKY